jgi:hypothetical protein
MKTVGFAGTAKNTGKTTTTIEVLRACRSAGLRVALTSIGYDGENRDNVTGLPKPRFQVAPGMVFATAEGCLRACTVKYRILAQTGLATSLGRIVIAEAVSQGLALVAGPNRRSDLALLYAALEQSGVDAVLVDGALNRLVPLIGTDGFVLSTGAAWVESIPELVRRTRALLDLYHPERTVTVSPPGSAISVLLASGDRLELEAGSLLSEDTARRIAAAIPSPVQEMVIPGACDPRALFALLALQPTLLAGMRLVFASPLHLMASGRPLEWAKTLTRLQALWITPGFLEKNSILFLTVNPFFPRYNQQTGAYLPAYVDADLLVESMQAAVLDLPVIDVLARPTPDLLRLCHFLKNIS